MNFIHPQYLPCGCSPSNQRLTASDSSSASELGALPLLPEVAKFWPAYGYFAVKNQMIESNPIVMIRFRRNFTSISANIMFHFTLFDVDGGQFGQFRIPRQCCHTRCRFVVCSLAHGLLITIFIVNIEQLSLKFGCNLNHGLFWSTFFCPLLIIIGR